MTYGIAAFQDGKFQGLVAREAKPESFEVARTIAARWEACHTHYSFRAVELDAKGFIARTDTTYSLAR